MQRSAIIFFAVLALTGFKCTDHRRSHQREQTIIDIQPFSGFSGEMVKKVASQIKLVCPNVNIATAIALPLSAYYPPRNRYRADSVIAALSRTTLVGHVTIGVTNKDISTTKGAHSDWGVMGLGYRPGNACVVSTFRLSKDQISSQFYKVCIHELGHTAGLPHCPQKDCFMRDAEGGNPTNDENRFCSNCRASLIKKGWLLK